MSGKKEGGTNGLGDGGDDRFKLWDVSRVECEEHMLDPLVLHPIERVQNRVHQLRVHLSSISFLELVRGLGTHEFTKVVDVAEES